jgi:hypothetical protein
VANETHTKGFHKKIMYNFPFMMKFIVTKLVLPYANVVAFITTIFDLWMSKGAHNTFVLACH